MRQNVIINYQVVFFPLCLCIYKWSVISRYNRLFLFSLAHWDSNNIITLPQSANENKTIMFVPNGIDESNWTEVFYWTEVSFQRWMNGDAIYEFIVFYYVFKFNGTPLNMFQKIKGTYNSDRELNEESDFASKILIWEFKKTVIGIFGN